jgi:hypothetical protein
MSYAETVLILRSPHGDYYNNVVNVQFNYLDVASEQRVRGSEGKSIGR